MKTLVYPLGHAVEIEGSAVACVGAAKRWPEEDGLFDEEPLEFHVEIAGEGTCDTPRFLPADRGFRFECGRGCATFDVLNRRGILRGPAGTIDALLEPLVLTALDWTFFVPVHAACVMREAKSVLLLGESHAGKSTLAFACSRAGWTFVADSLLHFANEPSNLLVSGSPAILLREGARLLFHVGQSKLEPKKYSRTAPLGPLVFLRRREGEARLEEGNRGEARAYLARHDYRPDRDYTERRHELLVRQGVYRLEYENATDAVPLLESLLSR